MNKGVCVAGYALKVHMLCGTTAAMPLLGSTMQNLSHGPFKSGRNQQSIQEAAAHLANTIRQDDFEELQELMALDLGVDVDDERVPQYPQDINNLPCIKNLPVFAPWL